MSGVSPGSSTIVLEIEHPLDVLQRHVEQEPDARRQRLQEPDMRHRGGEPRYGPSGLPDFGEVTSTPHFSQMMPLYFIRLYLPHRHS